MPEESCVLCAFTNSRTIGTMDRETVSNDEPTFMGISSNHVIAALPAASSDGSGHRLLYMSSSGSGPEVRFEFHSLVKEHFPEFLLDKCYLSTKPSHLSLPKGPDGEPNIHVVVSIRSGTWEAELFFRNVVQHILQAVGLSKSDYQVHHTSSEKSVIEFTTNLLLPVANAGRAQTVILLSGDGGMVDITNVLLESKQSPNFVKPCVGLLSLGSGNALANSSGLNSDKTRGLRSFLKGRPQSLPTFTVKFSPGSELLVDEARGIEALPTDSEGTSVLYGTVVCSWALHAALVADSDTTEYRKHGSERFSMAAKELLFPADGSKAHHFRGHITVTKKGEQGREINEPLSTEEHSYVLATMVSNLQQTLTISPHSKPLDGQLRLVYVGATTSEEIMHILQGAFSGGRHIGEDSVLYEPIESMRLDFAEDDSHWRRVCVDGKIVRVGENGWVSVRREARDILDLIAET